MTILLFIPAAVALFWAVMMLAKKDRLRSHTLMALALIGYVIAYILFFNLFREGSKMWQCILYMLMAFVVPGFHYAFFRKTVGMKRRINMLKILIPLNSAFIICYALLHLSLGKDLSDIFYHSFVLGENVTVPGSYITPLWRTLQTMTFAVFNSMLAIEGGALLIWAFIAIIRYDKLLDEYFAGKEGNEKKNNLLVFIALVLCVVPLVTLLAQPFYVIRENTMLKVVCVVLSAVAVFITGLYSYRIGFSADALRMMIDEDNEKKKLADEASQGKSSDIPLSENLYAECMARMRKAIEDDKVYLDPELSLISFSNILATNRTYLSRIINFNYNCTFSDYINKLRIDYATGSIMEKKKAGISMKEFSEECGYSTQASFIRNFTKYTGMTPTQYIVEQMKKR